jgi:hypothetical protein
MMTDNEFKFLVGRQALPRRRDHDRGPEEDSGLRPHLGGVQTEVRHRGGAHQARRVRAHEALLQVGLEELWATSAAAPYSPVEI